MSKGKHQHRLQQNCALPSERMLAQELMQNSIATSGDTHTKRERQIARDLRQTSWWKNKLQQPVCYYCNQKIERNLVTMDHLIPLSSGGKSVKTNLVMSCKDCNNRKKDQAVWEFNADAMPSSSEP